MVEGRTMPAEADDGRPTARLPMAQLLHVSVYRFGISVVWRGEGHPAVALTGVSTA